jgi:hypothetical protein
LNPTNYPAGVKPCTGALVLTNGDPEPVTAGVCARTGALVLTNVPWAPDAEPALEPRPLASTGALVLTNGDPVRVAAGLFADVDDGPEVSGEVLLTTAGESEERPAESRLCTGMLAVTSVPCLDAPDGAGALVPTDAASDVPDPGVAPLPATLTSPWLDAWTLLLTAEVTGKVTAAAGPLTQVPATVTAGVVTASAELVLAIRPAVPSPRNDTPQAIKIVTVARLVELNISRFSLSIGCSRLCWSITATSPLGSTTTG